MVLVATPGPSSSIDDSIDVISFRELYHSLELYGSATTATSKSDIHGHLVQAVPVFRTCGEDYPSSMLSSKAKATAEGVTLASGKVIQFTPQHKVLQSTIGQIHKLGESEVALLLRIFLDSDDANLDYLTASADDFVSPLQRSSNTRRRKRGGKDAARDGEEDIASRFFDSFTAFYFEEKLYILRCLSALLRIADDSFHELRDVAKEVLDQFTSQDFALKCLSQFHHLTQKELTDDIREVPRYGIFWSKHYLREQLTLLEVIFLFFYSRLDASASVVEKMFNVIADTDFGRAQACSGFFDQESSLLLDCIGSFLVLVTVESLELEKCMEGRLDLHSKTRDAVESSTSQLIDAPEVVGSCVDFLRSSTEADTLRAPLLLAFALFLSRVDTALTEWSSARPTEPFPDHLQALQSSLSKRGEVGLIWPDFASAALSPSLDLFGTLQSIIRSPLFRSDSAVSTLFSVPSSSSLAMRAVFKGLVLSITQLIRPEYIEDYTGLVNVWRDTFSVYTSTNVNVQISASDGTAAMCRQFWEADFDHDERRAVFTMATRRFPVSFRPLLQLSRALSGESNEPGEHSLRAATCVLGYLAQVNTLAQVMPATPSMSIPYEPVESHSPATMYRATRTISVFGKHLVIPAGTIGQMVSQSHQTPVIILWELGEAGYSVWRLLRDVLANLAGLLDPISVWKSAGKNAGDNESAVFQEEESVAHFSTMSPDDGSDMDGGVAADALNLFCAILSGGRYLSASLLAHLNGDDVGLNDIRQPTATETKPSLVDIALRLLDRSLCNAVVASPVILASLRLVTLLVPTASASIWHTMRSSNALTGSSGTLPFSSHGSSLRSASTSLLAHELLTGDFSGTLRLLTLHQTLLDDLQRTHYSSSPEAVRVKVEVVGRAAHFVLHHIWPEYQGWKYVSLRQQTEIGVRCTIFFNSICRDQSLRKSSLTSRVVDVVDDIFLSSVVAPSLAFAPLLRTLASGSRFVTTKQRASRQGDVELQRRHLISSLDFCLTMMARGGSTANGPPPMGTLESIAFDRERISPFTSGQGNLIRALADMILIPNEGVINTAATKALTCLCRAAGPMQATSQATSLVGHLGSSDDVEKFVNGLLDIVSGARHPPALVVQTWNLLSSIGETQAALATLLLTGTHLAASVEEQLADGQRDGAAEGKSAPLNRSAIKAAKDALARWRKLEEGPQQTIDEMLFVEGALKFLNVAWEHALEHREAFASLRLDTDLWSTIAQLAQLETGSLPMLPLTVIEKVIVDGEIESRSKSESSEEVCLFAVKRMCSAKALHLMLMDINIAPVLSSTAKSTSKGSSGKGFAFDRVMAILSKSASLTSSLQTALRFPCDVLMHDDVSTRLASTFPEMPLEDFCVPPRRDDFDFTRAYGDSYVYDIDLLQEKLLGFTPSVEEELEGDETHLAALQQAVLLVAGLNLNWCIIDAQSAFLSAWTTLLQGMTSALPEQQGHGMQALSTVKSSAMAAWIQCATISTEGDIESLIMGGIHAQRMGMLNALLKLTSYQTGQTLSNQQRDHEHDGPDEQVRDVLDQVEQMVTHPVYRVEDAMRNQAAFPRDIFEMVYLAVIKYRHLRARAGKEGKIQEKMAVLRAMQLSAETLAVHTITCLRVAIDNAWVTLTAKESTQGAVGAADGDVGLMTSIVEMMVDPASAVSPHIWVPRMQTTSVLSSAVDLFSRAPLEMGAALLPHEALASGAVPVFSQALLGFFFTLASQQSTAELLVLAGIVNGLCNNSLSVMIDSSEEPIPSRLANTSYANPSHHCWVQMLQIIVALVLNLEGAVGERFTQSEAWSFFKVFESRLMQALDVRMRATAASMAGLRRVGEAGQQDVIRLNQVEEIDLVLLFYLHIVRAKAVVPETDPQGVAFQASFKPYIEKITVLLQEYVHLLQHPRELTALVGSTAKQGSEDEEKIKTMLLSSSASIVSCMWEIGKGEAVLCSEPNDWELTGAMISPTISTSPSSPSSTGTLLDMATLLVEQILRRRTGKIGDEKLAFLLTTLEQTAALCSTQLVGSAYTRPNAYSVAVRKEVETGLGRDVKQGLEAARGAIQSVGQDPTFLDVILEFHSKWLPGSN